MISSGSLQVRPDSIIFRDLEPGESDTVDVWARNIGKKPIYVRFSLPQNQFFVLNAKANISTAPGLEAHATIKYTASTSEKETNELKVTCNDSTITVPIIAYPPTPAVQLATDVLDFGTVTLNSGQVRSFKFTNYGTIEGKFSISVTGSDSIKITPVFGLIDSNQTQEIQVTFKAEKAGSFTCQILVEVENNSEKIKPITAVAKVVDQSLTLHNPKGEEFGELNFQHLFYGQKKVIPLILRNRGSCTRNFTLLPLKSDSKNNDRTLPIFGISPMNGTVKAYSDVNINVTFNPRKNDSAPRDSEEQYSAAATIQIPETGQDISFNIIGTAVSLDYEITAVDFDFGRAALKPKQKQLEKQSEKQLKKQSEEQSEDPLEKRFSIRNNSLFLPLNLTIKQVAQFHFSPSSITLKPRESKEFSVTFQPVNLGTYNIKTHISFCGGIDRRDINLSGIATSSDTDESNYQRPGVWATVKDIEFYKDKPTTKYGLTMKELQLKQQQRKTYDSYITESAEKRAEETIRRNAKKEATIRAKKLLNDENNKFTEEDFEEYVTAQIQQSTGEAEDPVSLGLLHCEGMTPPEPPIMKVWQPFKLPETIGLFSTLNPRSRHKHGKNGNEVFDDKILIEKKFKPKPTTQAEINECSKKLQQSQQVLIVASHQNINFGNVSVFSSEKRSFQITNNLQQSIIVALKIDHEELKESGPQSQVVPPHQTCGFDICVHYDKPESFSKAFEYTINNDLTYSVNVNAEIVPIDVVVEPEVIHFSFNDDNCQPYIKEFVKLRNNSNSTAEFKWKGFDNVFTAHNCSGTIVPHGTYSTEITYKPDCNPHAEAMATVTVVGGPTQKLKMIGDTGKPKLQLAKKNVSFGLISLNSQQTQDLRIKNVGSDDAIYTVTPNLTDIISIMPTGGRIKSKEFVDLHVTVSCQKSGNFEVPIYVNICGSQPLTFTIDGQADVPKIKLTTDDLSFGKIYLGNTLSKKVTIANTGMIPAVAFFDMSKLPDFYIDFQPELSEVAENENKNSITLVTDSKSKDRFIQGERGPLSNDTIEDDDEEEENDKDHGLVYKMKIIEKSALNFSFVFQPRTVNKYTFDFPLTITNIDSDVSAELVRKVTAESMQAPLYPSEQAIDFGVTPLFDESNPNSRAPLKQLLLKNEYTKDIQFRFENKKSKNFQVDPQSGTIKYASNSTIFITFKATESLPYATLLPLYVTTDKGEILASEIQLMGVGSSIAYKASVPHVSLPPVPLGVQSHARIDIINISYINTELKADLPIVEKQFPLSVTFPDGAEMKTATRELPVEFSFLSNKPMSFSTVCAFVDPKGNSTSVTVSCMTDNSIFTLYPILSQKNYNLVAGDGKPIQAKMLSEDIKIDYIEKFLSIGNYLTFDKKEIADYFQSSKMTIDFIVKFLNSLVLSTKVKRFPDDFSASNGELVIEMISNLCGSHKPSNLSNILHSTTTSSSNANNSNKPKENGRYTNMKSLLTFLSSNGAMLPDVKPEFLLNQSDFCDAMRKKITLQLLGIDYYGAPEMSSYDQKALNDFLSSPCFKTTMSRHLKAVQSYFKALSTESWLRVILQVLRLFMFSKLQPERLLQIQGVQDALSSIKNDVDESLFTEINRSNHNLSSSNFFSAPESMILKWLTIHYCAKSPKTADVVIDYLRLHDPKYFIMVLRNHILNQEIPYVSGNDDESKNKNIVTAINVMEDFKIACIPTNKEMKEGDELVMLLLSYQLMEILPHFLPMATVEFVAPLSKQVVQSITITNPSKVPITYDAKIEGSQNFRALENSIQLGPNETADFLVEYVARKLDKETAILSLIPGKPKIEEPKAVLEPPKNDKSSTSTSRRSLNAKAKKTKSDKPEPPVFASTIVMNLVSSVNYDEPLKTIEVETNIYETKKMTIKVENAIQMPGKMKMINRLLNDDPRGQIEKLFNNPKEEPDYGEQKTLYESMLKKHQTFIFEQNKVNFKTEDSVESIDFEFTPISLGTFHCFLLFYNDKYGQFVYEIVGKANLPASIPTSANLKAEFGNKVMDTIKLEPTNKSLFNAIAYVNARIASFKQTMSESKFKETVQTNVRQLEKLYDNASTPSNFIVEVTSSYFKAPETFKFTTKVKAQTSENIEDEDNKIQNPATTTTNNGEFNKNESGTTLPVVFTPEKPGDYLCKLILKSEYDVRVLQIRAIGLAACKTMSVEMQTSSGKQVMQGIPFFNPSDTIWHFKATIQNNQNNNFTFPQSFTIQPNSVFDFPISFQSGSIGTYEVELNVVNTDKEAVYKYNVTAEVVDPSAEDKLEFEMKARQKFTYNLDVKPFIDSGTVSVTSTISLLNFPSTIQFANGKLVEPFTITGLSVESGKTTGTLTFTDEKTKAYIWYVIDISVDPPEPEEVIEVRTVARKTVTLKIPVHNPNNTEVSFDVNFTESDFFGPKKMVLKPYETSIYQLTFCPLTQLKRVSQISFYNQDEGEFLYSIDINVSAPDVCIMAPLQASIGTAVGGHVVVENPTDSLVHFSVFNDNTKNFVVTPPAANRSKEVDCDFELSPREKVQVEVRYIPSNVGVKETGLIGFKSKEIGDWFYKFAGIGKPPQPSPPIIVESMLELSSSGQAVFSNPFPSPTKYELKIMTEHHDVFKILNKRHFFTLNDYNEQLQIAFSFTPHSKGQFTGTILLTTVGLNPEIRWTFPIIGNTLSGDEQALTPLSGRSHSLVKQSYKFKLIGEKENFSINDYKVQLEIPESFNYLRNCTMIQPINIEPNPSNPDKLMLVTISMRPKRPLQTTCQIIIENPSNKHSWRFPIRINIESGGINKQLLMESQINSEKHESIYVDDQFRTRTEFEAYFIQGSAPEFFVVPDHGFIEPSISERTLLPIEVVFSPTTYGKLMHAVLVIDTIDTQYLFDLRGKVPDYVPPAQPLIGTINTTISDSLRRSRNQLALDGFNINNTVSAPTTPSRSARKRNFIKENMESARITKLSPAIRRVKTPFRH